MGIRDFLHQHYMSFIVILVCLKSQNGFMALGFRHYHFRGGKKQPYTLLDRGIMVSLTPNWLVSTEAEIVVM